MHHDLSSSVVGPCGDKSVYNLGNATTKAPSRGHRRERGGEGEVGRHVIRYPRQEGLRRCPMSRPLREAIWWRRTIGGRSPSLPSLQEAAHVGTRSLRENLKVVLHV